MSTPDARYIARNLATSSAVQPSSPELAFSLERKASGLCVNWSMVSKNAGLSMAFWKTSCAALTSSALKRSPAPVEAACVGVDRPRRPMYTSSAISSSKSSNSVQALAHRSWSPSVSNPARAKASLSSPKDANANSFKSARASRSCRTLSASLARLTVRAVGLSPPRASFCSGVSAAIACCNCLRRISRLGMRDFMRFLSIGFNLRGAKRKML
mmetsp:Transcript_22082/g.51533  ORF Transcript_22082/g.51533 Transcript_22082/m.51533 type:complete len:213 (+) Transcript_22082:266-904(+)